MDQSRFLPAVRGALEASGFGLVHESAAVAVYTHQRFPDLSVRVGTTHVIAERGGQECYRSSISGFDFDQMREQIHLITGNDLEAPSEGQSADGH